MSDTVNTGTAPVVSIVTAAYNAAATLEETVASVRAQTRTDWELVIVDDGSADETRTIAEGLAAEDPRIRVLSQRNAGTAAARNAGVRESRAEWLCMLDADDLLIPDFLERMLAFAVSHPGYDIYSPTTTMLLRDGRRVPLMTGAEWERVRSVTAAVQMRESSVAQVSLVARGVFDRVGGYRPVYSEDYDFWLRALILGARQVQAQVHAADAAGMLADAKRLLALGEPGQIVVKIPATRQGLQAGAQLSAAGVPVTYTAVYAAEQAHFAAQLGAAYAAPYLGRLQDSGADGMALIAQMQSLIDRSGAATRLLVASVRTREAYLGLLQLGVGAITIPPRLFAELLDHPATLEAERGFLADAAGL